MNIHEYQAKALFEKFGVPAPKGAAAKTLEEIPTITDYSLLRGAGSSRGLISDSHTRSANR